MGIRTDLLVTEEIAESSDLRATPFEFERAKRVEAALSILEGKWKIVILNRLFARPVWRFSELERSVPGISQRMLSQQLRLLEKCELVILCKSSSAAAKRLIQTRNQTQATFRKFLPISFHDAPGVFKS